MTPPEEAGLRIDAATGERPNVDVVSVNRSPSASGPAELTVAATPSTGRFSLENLNLIELVKRCLTGDAAAWEELARGQQRRVYGICYRFTGSATDAEDLTQEVFIKMYRNLSSFDAEKGSFSTWLTTLTRNLLVDHYRRARMDRSTDSLDESADSEDGAPTRLERLADRGRSQEQVAAGSQLRAQIQAALTKVSPELREAVVLRDIEDMDYREIAEALAVPVGTVKSRISRGRAELARLLKNLEGQVI